MPSGTDIEDLAALNRAATGAYEIAGRTRTTGAHPVDETCSAAQEFGGGKWDGGLGGALGTLARTWSSQVASLAEKCDALSRQCGGSGLLYQRTEATNTQSMRSLTGGSTPFG